MPRKKKQQPLPFETFVSSDDGFTYEIRGPGSYLISRGSHKVDAHEELCVRITEYLIEKFKFVTAEGVGDLKIKPLVSWQELDLEMQRCGKFPESSDSGAVRKRIYPSVKRQCEAFWWAKKRSLSQ